MPAEALTVRVIGGPVTAIDAEMLILPAFEGEELLPESFAWSRGEIARALASREFAAETCAVFVTPIDVGAPRPRRLMLVGLGARATADLTRVWRAAAAAGLAARERRAATVAFLLPQPVSGGIGAFGTDAVVQAVAEGLVLAQYEAAAYKTGTAGRPQLERGDLWLPLPSTPGVVEAARRGCTLGHCCNRARALANEPGNLLTPRVFADRAGGVLAGTGLSVEVLDEAAIRDLGMALFAGVAQGSHEPPRLIVIRHAPPAAPRDVHLGFVGKGITFDSGGLTLKAGKGMERMKDDMAGGAAVVGAMRALAELGAPVRVTGIVPSAENMPGGGAIRPGDVLRSASGRTVEVIDTDAEGRLVLADALWYARRLGVTHLVDIATLTGACTVALGSAASGLFAAPAEWLEALRGAAGRAGERVWPLPLFEDYRDQLKSEIADMVNVGGRPAGAATAAMFLQAFAGDGPWAHLDIAGTAWQEEAERYMPKGPTGVGVRTLVRLALDQSGAA